MRKHEIPVLIAIFLDLAGFGMAFPDVQLRAESLGASGPLIGIILASLFVVQFIASPIWGKFSDAIGRKPVAILCTLLSAVSMILYATTDSLGGIFLSRIVAGLAAANVVVAQAYLADRSSEENRGQVMGRIGAAISTGLIAGPFLGGRLVEVGGSRLMGFVAAAASGIGALVLLIGMSNPKPKGPVELPATPIFDFRLIRDIPRLKMFFLLAAVAWFSLACLEGTFGRLVADMYQYPLQEFGMTFTKPQGASGAIFGLESLIAFLVQGLLFARISRSLSSRSLLLIGFILQGAGLLLTPFAPSFAVLVLWSGIFSFGGAIANPTINAVCSQLVPENRQGELFGLLQASRSVGFLFGPILGGALFDWHRALTYVAAGAVLLGASVLVNWTPQMRLTQGD